MIDSANYIVHLTEAAFYAVKKNQAKKKKVVDRCVSKSRKIRSVVHMLFIGFSNFVLFATLYTFNNPPGIIFTKKSWTLWRLGPQISLPMPFSYSQAYLALKVGKNASAA